MIPLRYIFYFVNYLLVLGGLRSSLFLTKELLELASFWYYHSYLQKKNLSINFLVRACISRFTSGVFGYRVAENFRAVFKSFIWLVDKDIPDKLNTSWCKIRHCSGYSVRYPCSKIKISSVMTNYSCLLFASVWLSWISRTIILSKFSFSVLTVVLFFGLYLGTDNSLT